MNIAPPHTVLNHEKPVTDFELRRIVRDLHRPGIMLIDRGEGTFSRDCMADGHYWILYCRDGVELAAITNRLREAGFTGEIFDPKKSVPKKATRKRKEK
jgi:hypothetical protein